MKYSTVVYHEQAQANGKLNHESIDNKFYSSSKDILQWLDIYSEIYGLCGKIDLYNKKTKVLTERKSRIQTIYRWYKYQLHAQYYCLVEMWHDVQAIKCYSLEDNKVYNIPLPTALDKEIFEQFLARYRKFTLDQTWFTQNPKKCARCIYRELCDYYLSQNGQDVE